MSSTASFGKSESQVKGRLKTRLWSSAELTQSRSQHSLPPKPLLQQSNPMPRNKQPHTNKSSGTAGAKEQKQLCLSYKKDRSSASSGPQPRRQIKRRETKMKKREQCCIGEKKINHQKTAVRKMTGKHIHTHVHAHTHRYTGPASQQNMKYIKKEYIRKFQPNIRSSYQVANFYTNIKQRCITM